MLPPSSAKKYVQGTDVHPQGVLLGCSRGGEHTRSGKSRWICYLDGVLFRGGEDESRVWCYLEERVVRGGGVLLYLGGGGCF